MATSSFNNFLSWDGGGGQFGGAGAGGSWDDADRSQQRLSDSNLPAGAVPEPAVTSININRLTSTTQAAQGSQTNKTDNIDFRVRLKVPPEYADAVAKSSLNEYIKDQKMILFPLTPLINVSQNAEYDQQKPIHSNQSFYFYKSSSADKITIQAKWPVQDERDAANWLAAVHMFRALLKMRFGSDSDAGSPPPVCRLMAYGTYVLDNVPVVVSSFRVDLPDSVDYYRHGRATTGSSDDTFKVNMVPVFSTLNVDFIPVYSRQEILNSSVSAWLKGTDRIRGLL